MAKAAFFASRITVLTFLLIGILTNVSLGAVDCDARPNHPQCRAGTPAPAVVLDSTGAHVGLYAPFGTNSGGVIIRNDDGRAVVLFIRTDPTRSFLLGADLVSESTNCAEPLFAIGGPSALNPATPRAAIGPNSVLYVQPESSTFVTINVGSEWSQVTKTCFLRSGAETNAVQLSPGQTLDFVPPFRVE